MKRALSYVLPLKATEPPDPEFFDYINRLSALVEVLLVDGSAPDMYRAIDERCCTAVRHVPPHDDLVSLRNGKVRGVLTGFRLATHEHVVIADDDVRYSEAALDESMASLHRADVVRPQNYFVPLPWHARLDTARILINRVTGGDWPGTLAVKRSALGPGLAYDGNVLFENLELVRTIRAAGGTELSRPDLFVARRPPTTDHFFSQRVRQAYDEFARPHRLIAALSILPVLSSLLVTGHWWLAAATFVGAPVLAAEAGRRQYGGGAVFPPSSALWAPAWVLERGLCAWLALGMRAIRGGVPYAGHVLTVAANSERTIARRLAGPSPVGNAETGSVHAAPGSSIST